MAYISDHVTCFLGDRITKKGNLMDYIIGSCDLSKNDIYIMVAREQENLMDHVIRSCDLPKKEIFDGLHKHFFGFLEHKFPFLEI